jgi:hypothetical protein
MEALWYAHKHVNRAMGKNSDVDETNVRQWSSEKRHYKDFLKINVHCI